MRGDSKIIRPEANKPLTAIVVNSEMAPNNFGGPDQVKLTLEGGRLLYMPAAAARAIAAGNAYTICKKQIKEGFKATWDVRPLEPEPEPVRTAARPGDSRLRVEPVYDDGYDYAQPPPPEEPLSPLGKQLAQSLENIKTKAAAAMPPAPSRLAAALCAAVDAAGFASKHAKEAWGVDLVFDAEMTTRLAITAYIQNGKSSQ